MAREDKQFRELVFSRRILVIVGGYGSGKSEVAVNLARHLAVSQGVSVAIADLDIVNPYFRSREAADRLRALGIRPIVPKGGHVYADLPIILPEIRAAIEGFPGMLLLDVGGDEAGARVLSSLTDVFPEDEYDMLFVLNANRPFAKDIAGCISMMQSIERVSRLHFTGLISNTHMLSDTDAETVLQGMTLASKLSKRTSLPVVFVSATREVLGRLSPKLVRTPVLALDRYLTKPWEKAESGEGPSSPLEE